MEFVCQTLAMNEKTGDCDSEESNLNAIIRKCNEKMATNDDIGYSEPTKECSLFQQTLGEIAFAMGVENYAAEQKSAAAHQFAIATEQYHAGAAFNLGLCYERGDGVGENAVKAMECYRLASAMGHAKAMYNLGVYHAKGLGGLEIDRHAAMTCLKAARASGLKEPDIQSTREL